jgi:hypothetical protein
MWSDSTQVTVDATEMIKQPLILSSQEFNVIQRALFTLSQALRIAPASFSDEQRHWIRERSEAMKQQSEAGAPSVPFPSTQQHYLSLESLVMKTSNKDSIVAADKEASNDPSSKKMNRSGQHQVATMHNATNAQHSLFHKNPRNEPKKSTVHPPKIFDATTLPPAPSKHKDPSATIRS